MKNGKINKKAPSLWKSIDWLIIFIYMVLLALGWMSVCGACYDFDQTAGILDFSTRSGMQIVWIGTSLLLAFLILMTDDRIFESLSYIIYIGFLALLFVTPFMAHDIKGSLSWIKVGSFSIQPAEFAKFGVALCLAKVMSTYGFDVRNWRDFIICIALIVVPMGLIVMQKETGSALVYSALFLMLYREDYYNREAENKNTAELIVAKNRHGSVGTIPLQWDGRYTRFASVDATHKE